jgi:hypothetical protein
MLGKVRTTLGASNRPRRTASKIQKGRRRIGRLSRNINQLALDEMIRTSEKKQEGARKMRRRPTLLRTLPATSSNQAMIARPDHSTYRQRAEMRKYR